MKTRILFLLLFFCSFLVRAQELEVPSTKQYKLTVTNSFLQLFHPTTSVFAVGAEARTDFGLAFYGEAGLPLKSFNYAFNNETKLNWTYYKTRIGARYYIDPVKPYKYRRRYKTPRLKNYRNFFGIEGMVGAETFDRENSYYYVDNTMVSYSRATVVILSRSFIFNYGREFYLTDRFIARLYVGLGQRFTNVTHESVLVESSSPGFGFFGFGSGVEYTEGIRRLPYVKLGFDIGIRMLERR